jgi:dihydrofolate reductase
VFSHSLQEVSWQNTQLIKADLVSWVREQKQQPGKDMCILGSGSLIVQLAQAGLIDEFQVSVNPVVLGGGRTVFEGLTHPVPLKLTRSRTFANGNVLLCYQPSH